MATHQQWFSKLEVYEGVLYFMPYILLNVNARAFHIFYGYIKSNRFAWNNNDIEI